MSVTHKRLWLIFAIVLAVAAVSSFQSFDPAFAAANHLSFALLPCLGSLALLPSDPGAWITTDARPALSLEVYAPAIPPRAPPV